MFGKSFSQIGYSTLNPVCDNKVSVSHSSSHCNTNITLSKKFRNFDVDFEVEEKIGKICISLDKKSVSVLASPNIYGFNPTIRYGANIFSFQIPFGLYGYSGLIGRTSIQNERLILLFLEKEWKISDAIIQGKLYVLPSPSGSIFLNYKNFSFLGLINILSEKYKAKIQYNILSNTKAFYELYIQGKKVKHLKAGISTIYEGNTFGIRSDFLKQSIQMRILSQVTNNIKCCGSLCYSRGSSVEGSFGAKVYVKFARLFANINTEKELFLGVKSDIGKNCKINFLTKFSANEKQKFDLSISFDH